VFNSSFFIISLRALLSSFISFSLGVIVFSHIVLCCSAKASLTRFFLGCILEILSFL